MTVKNVFVILDGPLGPHLIIYVNKVIHGGPMISAQSPGNRRWETEFYHVENQSILTTTMIPQ